MPSPLAKLDFKPGLDLDNTILAAENTYADGNFIRFVRGLPQFIKGRSQASSQTIRGLARGAHAWPSRDGTPTAAFGTTLGLYGHVGADFREISPITQMWQGTGSTTSGNASMAISAYVGLPSIPTPSVGDRIWVRVIGLNATPDAADVDGYGTVASVSAPSITVTLDKAPAATVSNALILYAYPRSIIGTSTADGTSTARASYWSMDNFGEQLVAVKGPPSDTASADYPLWAWTPRSTYANIINNPAMTSDTTWAKGAGWAYGATSQRYNITGGTTNLSQNIAGEMLPGRLYTAVFTITHSRNGGDTSDTTYTGVGYLKINAGDPAASIHVAPISTLSSVLLTGASQPSAYSGTVESDETRAKFTARGTYIITFYAPQAPSDIVFQAGTDDASGTGTFGVDDVTVFIWPNAYPVTEAPLNMSSIFTFKNVMMAIGGIQVNGDYNPLVLRCCDLGNFRSWVPDTGSMATEVQLDSGGRGVGGVRWGSGAIVFTDAGMSPISWIGSAGQAFQIDRTFTGCGLMGANAVCEQNGYVFWASKTGPYTFSGGAPQIIESTMKADVFDNMADYQENKVWVRMHPEYNEVWFGYADARDSDGANKEVSRQAVFNFVENHWTRHIWDVTSWIAPGIFDNPIGFSAESATTGKMMWHEMGGSDNGSALSAFLVTGAFDIEDGGNIMRVTEVWPEWKDLTCDLTYTLNTRMYPHAPNMVAGTPMVMKPTTIPPLRPRRDGRQFQIKLETTTTTLGGRQGVLRVRAQKTGASR